MLPRIGICELHEDTKITEDTYQVVVDRHCTHIEQYRTSANERSYLRRLHPLCLYESRYSSTYPFRLYVTAHDSPVAGIMYLVICCGTTIEYENLTT
jgi:hypothetical protein